MLGRYADIKESLVEAREWRQLTINLLRRDLDLNPAYELPDQDHEPPIYELHASQKELIKNSHYELSTRNYERGFFV